MVKIIAICGWENGRSGTKYETKQIDEEIVKLSGKKHPEVLFIPPISPFQESYFNQMQKIFRRLGCKMSPLYLNDVRFSTKELEKTVLCHDIIYVGGGNTLKMLKSWRKYGLDRVLLKATKKDIVLSGLSAGAICWFRYGCSDSRKNTNPKKGFIRIKGLDLVQALYCPHYNDHLNRKSDLKKMMERTNEIGLAFDSCSAIEIIDNEYRIITSNKKANAYRVYWKNKQYYEEIVEKKNTFSPLKDLLIK